MSLSRFLRHALLSTVLAIPFSLSAQQVFPGLDGENVQGEKIHLPTADGTGWTIVAVVCSKKAQPALEEWFAPAYNRFVMKSGLFAASYAVDLYLVPIFTGLDKAAYGPSMSALKKHVDADVAKQVVFVKGDDNALLEALDIKNKSIPYFFTVDPSGKIVHRESGTFSVDKLDALEAPML